MFDLPLFPERASTMAPQVDYLYFYLVAVSAFFTLLIFVAVAVFAVRYRRRSEDERPRPVAGSLLLEAAWSLIPLGIAMTMFGWSAVLYFRNAQVPRDALKIYVVGKQWMWKVQHAEGQREINELHVPAGRDVQLVMTSEDVIHSFFVPVFRTKMDVLPGKYTTQWFRATKPGRYHLFCAEYCGTEHSRMIGWVYVMEPGDYEDWLSGGGGQSMAAAGQALFQQLGCANCHDPKGRCPVLGGLYGNPVKLESGQTVTADENYIRESILNPGARIVAGYPNIMPTFQGQVGEEGLLQLIAYVRSLGGETPSGPPPVSPAPGRTTEKKQ